MTTGSGSDEDRRMPALTSVSANQWFTATFADPLKAMELIRDPRGLLLSAFSLTPKQRDHIFAIPDVKLEKIRDALDIVVRRKGKVSVERDAENKPGRLVMKYSPSSSAGNVSPKLSIGIAHCTFDADCGNWQCGWGPG